MKNLQIRVELAKAGMSQADLAELMGVSKQTLSTSLGTFEMSQAERAALIKLIREHAKGGK